MSFDWRNAKYPLKGEYEYNKLVVNFTGYGKGVVQSKLPPYYYVGYESDTWYMDVFEPIFEEDKMELEELKQAYKELGEKIEKLEQREVKAKKKPMLRLEEGGVILVDPDNGKKLCNLIPLDGEGIRSFLSVVGILIDRGFDTSWAKWNDDGQIIALLEPLEIYKEGLHD